MKKEIHGGCLHRASSAIQEQNWADRVLYSGITDKAGEGQDAGTMCHTLAAPVEGALKN